MNSLMAALTERLAAVWIERVAGSKVTTIAGLIGIAGTAVAQCTGYIPPKYQAMVTLAGVILAGTAAILARDSASTPVTLETGAKPSAAVSATSKLGCLALIALLLAVPMEVGCGTAVAQDIVNWTPALQSAVAVVDTAAAAVDPAAGAVLSAATVGFDAASNLVVAQAKAYLANPSAGLLAQLESAVTTFQQTVSAAVLDAAKIVNPASQQHALTAINAVGTIINTILALVTQIAGKTAVAQMASHATIKLAQVEPYMRPADDAQILADHYGESQASGEDRLVAGLVQLQDAGF